jgi:hypothetical protein
MAPVPCRGLHRLEGYATKGGDNPTSPIKKFLESKVAIKKGQAPQGLPLIYYWFNSTEN